LRWVDRCWLRTAQARRSDTFSSALTLDHRFGIPRPVLMALSYIGSTSLPTSGQGVSLTPTEARLGTVLSIIMFLLVFLVFTV